MPGWVIALTVFGSPVMLFGQAPAGQAGPEASVVLIRSVMGASGQQGSGVVISPGVVATNAHVVSGADRVIVTKGSDVWTVRNFCVEPDRDLCLLEIPGLTVPPAAIGTPQDAYQGRTVHSIGYPDGKMKYREGKLIANWYFQGSHLIQSNAAISPGSSGGGLFTEDGKLLGITTFIYGGNGRLNFSIPIAWIGRLQSDGALRARLICPGVARENITHEFFEHISEDPRNWESWDALSRYWVQDSPQDPNAWYARGLALSHNLQMQLEQPGAEVDPRQIEESLQAYMHAVELGPRLSKAWNNLGAALDHLSRFEEAQKAFEQAIQLKPTDPLPWLNLGSTLFSSQKYQQALEPFRKGLELQGDNATGWSRLAYCEGALGHWVESIRCFRIALRWCPARSAWWEDLYLTCLKVRDMEGAGQALARLQELNPSLAQQLEAAQKRPKRMP